jgi:pilus assembly protein CpaC
MSFTPTVLANGVINLRIAPQVTELDFTNAVTISGTTVPAFTTRNAETTVELRSGQSFAIAGLLQANDTRNIDQIPWLGSVPVLGALFSSKGYQKAETDLVVIITPELVKPAVPGQRLATPLDDRLNGNDKDFFLMGQPEVKKDYSGFVASGGGVQGPYGHMIPPAPHSSDPGAGNGAGNGAVR